MNVIRAIEIDTISEEVLLEILRDHIQKQLPADAKLRKCEFSIKRNPTRVELECDAVFGDIDEPVKKETTKDEALEETKEETITEPEKVEKPIVEKPTFETKPDTEEDPQPEKADPLANILGSKPMSEEIADEPEPVKVDAASNELNISAIFG